MPRPITLFHRPVGRSDVRHGLRKANLYDGVEIACWGDHFEGQGAGARWPRRAAGIS